MYKRAAFNQKPVNHIDGVKDWGDVVDRSEDKNTRKAILDFSRIKKLDPSFDIKDYLLTHCTIMCSLLTEPWKKWYITPDTSQYLNGNYDGWTNGVLKNSYKSFMGAFNAIEHIQIFPDMARGYILDAVLRKVGLVYYVDILVATHKKHKTLVQNIEDGKLDSLSMGCGLAGTSIITDSGCFKSIENIKVGDEVLTHTGKVQKVHSLFSTHISDVPLYSIHAVGLYEPLRLTGEHPILIVSKDSIECSYQKSNKKPCKVDSYQSQCFSKSLFTGKSKQKNCGRDKSQFQYDIKFLPIAEAKKGDYLVKTYPTEVVDNKDFTPALCRLLGIYAGDGCLQWMWKDSEKEYPYNVCFCTSSNEKTYHGLILDLLKQVCPESSISIKEVPERTGTYITVNDKQLAAFMFNHVGEYAGNKKFSKAVMQLPLEKQKQVINGLFDSDGCFYQSELSYSTSSIDLWNQIHILLLRNKIVNAQERCLRKDTGKKQGHGEYLQHTIFVGKGSAWQIETWKNLTYGQEPKVKNDLCFFYKNYYLAPIKEASKIYYSGMVYNFGVEEDESYLINNVAVHNCQCSYTYCSQCGNKAVEEEDLCEHITKNKGQTFIDENGVERIIGELCGDETDPESVQFIEASWVKTPAFTGAVLNRILTPSTRQDISLPNNMFHIQPRVLKSSNNILKAASQNKYVYFDRKSFINLSTLREVNPSVDSLLTKTASGLLVFNPMMIASEDTMFKVADLEKIVAVVLADEEETVQPEEVSKPEDTQQDDDKEILDNMVPEDEPENDDEILDNIAPEEESGSEEPALDNADIKENLGLENLAEEQQENLEDEEEPSTEDEKDKEDMEEDAPELILDTDHMEESIVKSFLQHFI